MDALISSIYDSQAASAVNITDFGLATATSLLLGLVIALTYMYRTRFTKSYVVTLALLPAIICVIIMMVNGSIGTGIAVAVRYRAQPKKSVCCLWLWQPALSQEPDISA